MHPQGIEKLRNTVKESCEGIGAFFVGALVSGDDAGGQSGLDHVMFPS